MRNKMVRNTLILSIILIALIATMVIAFSTNFETLDQQTADAAGFAASFESKDGYLYDSSEKNIINSTDGSNYTLGSDGKYHMTSTKYTSLYGSGVTAISTAAQLKSFISSAADSNSKGVLTADIDYNMNASGFSVASNAKFGGILDGNGYKVTITPKAADTCIDDNFITDYSTLFGEERKYFYTGLLMGSNTGTIKNINIELVSHSTDPMDPNCPMTSGGGTIINRSSYSSSNNYPTCAGIVCGIVYGGTIYNTSLTVTGAFVIGHAAVSSTNNTRCQWNSCIVGGMCGALREGTIERCTVTNNGGIAAVADGTGSGSFTKNACAVAGGICGIIKSVTTARIVNCSLAGNGHVNAHCGETPTNRNNDGFWSFAGGAFAGDIIVGSGKVASGTLADNQVSGLISAWTGARTDNWKQEKGSAVEHKTIYGMLFDVLVEENGTFNPSSISKVVILYDYIGYAQSNGATTTTLDSNEKIGYGSWAEIYKDNGDGALTVGYDYSKTGDNIIRVEAVANNFETSDSFKAATTAKSEATATGYKGYFIWDLKHYQSKWRGDSTATVTNTPIKTKDSYGADLRFVNADTQGALIYRFGEKATLSFENKNTQIATSNWTNDNSKYYDGTKMLLPGVKVQRSGSDWLTISDDAYSLSVTYTILDGTEDKTVYALSDLDHIYLPGKYSVQSSKTVDNIKYAYYDEASCVLVDFNDNEASQKYDYTILEGDSLFNAAVESNSVTWLKEDTITFNYANKANVIDYYSYARGNAEPSDLIAMPSTVNGAISITESGKPYYTLYAYVENPYYGSGQPDAAQYLQVGTTSVQVFIDTIAPRITSINYYLYDAKAVDNLGAHLNSVDLEEWQYDDIIVTYEVRDDNRSGLESGSGHISYTEVNYSTWSCVTRLTGIKSSVTVFYEDTAGNIAEETFSALIDTTPIDLRKVKALNSGEYLSYYAQLGYCPETVKISYTPDFGASGAYLQYSYQKDNLGNDIWVGYASSIVATETYYRYDGSAYVAITDSFLSFGEGDYYIKNASNEYVKIPTKGTLKSGQPNTLIIDFEILNSNFKMRLVSKENLYPDAYANGTGLVTNGANKYEDSILWNVKIIIAGIWVDLDNLFYDGVTLKGKTAEELTTMFSKTYDASNKAGSNLYNNNKLRLQAKIYANSTEENPILGVSSVIYSELYTYASPRIEEDYLDVDVTYSTANVGNNIDVTIKIDSVGEYYNKYLVRFYTGSETGNLNDLTTNNTLFPITKTIASATISKATLNVDLSDYSSQLSNSYIYGDAIPSEITIQGVGGEDIILTIETDAKITQDDEGKAIYPVSGTYPATASFKVANANYDLNVTGINITIAKKDITVTTYLDGEEYYNTTITFDGLEHSLVGTFIDVYNEKANAIITYYTDANCTVLVSEEEIKGVTTTGTYYGKITVENDNYVVSNSGNPVKFTITKGYLNLNLDAQTKNYNGQAQEYTIITAVNIDPDYYSSGTFTVKYYKVTDGVADISTAVTPAAVGKYLVQITFANCNYFYDKAYDDTYLTIKKAPTVASADNITIAYDATIHKYTIEAAKFKVTANGGNTGIIVVSDDTLNYTIYDGTSSREANTSETAAVIELRSFDQATRAYKLVDEDNKAEYMAAGEYGFRIMFLGDDCFESSSCTPTFTIEPAKFEGLTFEADTFYYVDSSADNYHSVEVQGALLQTYLEMGAVIKYKYLGSKYIDRGDLGENINTDAEWSYRLQKNTENEYEEVIEGTPFKFSNVGEYLMSATVTLDNYTNAFIMTTLKIDKSKMPKVTAVYVEAEYDGNFHPAKFTIADHDYEEYFIPGYEDIKYLSYIMMGTDRINVRYDDAAAPLDAGEYYGEITLTSDSFATEKVVTHVTITQKQIDNVSFDSLDKIINKLDSSTNLSKIYPTFTDALGEKAEATYEFYDLNGNKVELNSDGTLDPGTYIVRISFEDGNYYTTQEAEITIVKAASKGSNNTNNDSEEESSSIMDIIQNNMLYVIIGGAALGVIIVVIIVVSVVKSKKKNSRRRPKRTPPPTRGGPPPKPSAPKKPQNTAPVKKKPSGPQDRATF